MGRRGGKGRLALRVLSVAVLGGVTALGLLSATSRAPENLGVDEGRLAPCPPSPNCVCSQDDDPAHRVEPIPYAGTDPVPRLVSVVQGMTGARVVEATQTYLRAEFTSLLFRFVDDVEFLVDEKARVIHVRSASRVGYSDLGVNRRRVEAIRSAFAGLPPRVPTRAPPGEPFAPHPGRQRPSAMPDRDRQAIRQVVETQLAAFACDDAETAFALASPGIQRRYGDAETFLREVARGYPPVYRQDSVRYGEVAEEQGVPVLVVNLRTEDGEGALALYALEKQEDGEWRINGCRLLRHP